MSKKLSVGVQIPDFSFSTPFETGRTLEETLSQVSGKTVIIFSRFYGCRLAKYDIAQYAAAYSKITGLHGQVLVVLQSQPEIIRDEVLKENLPFEIICDPQKTLYQLFRVVPGTSEEALTDEKTAKKLEAAVAAGIVKGVLEGEHLQLPAAFIVGHKRKLLYAYYGVSGGDLPTPEEISEILENIEEF